MIKHYPIATKNNNRYRGPVETNKINIFYDDIEYNINYLKNLFEILKEKTIKIDNNIKTRKSDNTNSLIKIHDFIEIAGEDFDK